MRCDLKKFLFDPGMCLSLYVDDEAAVHRRQFPTSDFSDMSLRYEDALC